MRLGIWICTAVLLLIAGATHGEYYRYVDENGIVSYTDDLSKLTDKQRGDVKTFVSEKNQADPGDNLEKQTENPSEGDTSTDLSAEDANRGSQENRQLKESLDREFEALSKKRVELAMERKQIKNTADLQIFNRNATALNDQIKAYELKKQAYVKTLVDSDLRSGQ